MNRKTLLLALYLHLCPGYLIAQDGLFGQGPASTSGEAAVSAEAVAPDATPVMDHLVHLGDDGRLVSSGENATDAAHVSRIFTESIPRARDERGVGGVLLHSHGGLMKESWVVGRAEYYRDYFEGSPVYPVTLVWPNDLETILPKVAGEIRRRLLKAPGAALNTLGDRLARKLGLPPRGVYRRVPERERPALKEQLIEEVVRAVGGTQLWEEMKRKALAATVSPEGGARQVAAELARLRAEDPDFGIHISAHSAGAVLMVPLIQLLATDGVIQQGPLQGERGYGLSIQTVQLRGAAITTRLFDRTLMPLIESGQIGKVTLYNLDEPTEWADSIAYDKLVYGRSLLYLVKYGFERVQGSHLVGLAESYRKSSLRGPIKKGIIEVLYAPSDECEARGHEDLGTDAAAMKSTLRRIVYYLRPEARTRAD